MARSRFNTKMPAPGLAGLGRVWQMLRMRSRAVETASAASACAGWAPLTKRTLTGAARASCGDAGDAFHPGGLLQEGGEHEQRPQRIAVIALARLVIGEDDVEHVRV